MGINGLWRFQNFHSRSDGVRGDQAGLGPAGLLARSGWMRNNQTLGIGWANMFIKRNIQDYAALSREPRRLVQSGALGNRARLIVSDADGNNAVSR
jgi:hypothetical protein